MFFSVVLLGWALIFAFGGEQFLDLTGNTLQSTILMTSMDQLRYLVACITRFCVCWLVFSSFSVYMVKVFLLGEKQEHIMFFL
jgi:hypothetical protein